MARRIVQFVAVVAATSTSGALADSANVAEGTAFRIIDLSQDLAEDLSAMSSSPGALKVKEVASNDPFMRAALVLENGKVVAKYYRDDVDKDEPFQVWSTTKSWTSLLIGLLVDEGSLSIDDTLGDIFKDEASWADVTDGTVEYRKNVTIHEMLTMTSGLVTPEAYSEQVMMNFTQEELTSAFESVLKDGGEEAGGGSSLSASLAFPEIGTKDEFSYLGLSNILSYVIQERSGKTPRELLQAKVMPALGIKNDEYNWLQTKDGVEFSFHGIEATVLHMAKFGQLYLQEGRSVPVPNAQSVSRTKLDPGQVISKEWVDSTFKPYAEDNTWINLPYGYLVWKFSDNNIWCTAGLFGQDTCVDQDTGRVIAQQRDKDPENIMGGNFIIPAAVSDATLSFAAEEVTTTTPKGSGATGIAVSAASLLVTSSVLFL